MTEEEIYAQPFSIDSFNKLPYSPRLELMIAPDGSMRWARPSHQECLIKEVMQRLGMTREEVSDACPPEYYAEYLTWLWMQCGTIPVWSDFVLAVPLTEGQVSSLHVLKAANLYHGHIPAAFKGELPYQPADTENNSLIR